VERFQQTLKKWLAAQLVQPATLAELQALLDQFTTIYNHQRPHRALTHRVTPPPPTTPFPKPSRPPAATTTPTPASATTASTTVALSPCAWPAASHLGVGRTHARTHVLMLVDDLHVRIVNAATGELLRELTIDPSRNYQPTGRPPGPQRKRP
jgi:Integrase core domain